MRKAIWRCLFVVVSAAPAMLCPACAGPADVSPASPGSAFTAPDEVYRMPPGIETRWASVENPTAAKGQGGQAKGGRKGNPHFPIAPGETRVLAEEKSGTGTIRRIWATTSDRTPLMLRGIRLDFYWDGADKPAASVPLGDFFCMGLGRAYAFENEYFSSPEGRSFNCCIPMPFKKGMRITVTNTTKVALSLFFYDIDYTVGDPHGPDTLYFHAYFNRENPTTLRKDYEFLPKISGRGRFLGVNVGVIADTGKYFNAWWGEGEAKFYVDGDTEFPTLCGTGTEDYIGTGWFLGQYAHRYQGCPYADKERFQFCFYRFHVKDPVYFRKDLRVTMQQIGCWTPDSKPQMVASGKKYILAGAEQAPVDWTQGDGKNDYGLFEREDDWSSCCYFYLDRPENDLPPLKTLDERVKGLY
ncbi:MAG TPA: DUF2961 domain-containing protein [Candidatus Hydrogenedentes bacterium]|nr:DUF2961 domain-containing protein [Candidatus Hydrogenedentota bacterium]